MKASLGGSGNQAPIYLALLVYLAPLAYPGPLVYPVLLIGLLAMVLDVVLDAVPDGKG